MSRSPLLDTHVWLWWLLGDERLDRRQAASLDGMPPDERPFLCDISLWELAMLVELGRLQLDEPLHEFLRIAASPATVRLCRIDPACVVEMNALPASFHRDPADRLIVATARARRLRLATYDRLIVDSGLVDIWKPQAPDPASD